MFGKDEDEQKPRRFVMREEMFSIGDDYWIEDGDGNRVFRVDGKALRFRDTFVLEDASGREVAKIQERKLSLRDKMAIERDGHTIATVRTAMGWGDRYHIEVDGRMLMGHMGVTNDGSVHYHPVPNVAFPSAVDLVKKLIDIFPGDFTKKGRGGMGGMGKPAHHHR